MIHLIRDGANAGTLKSAGVQRIVPDFDWLSHGPSDLDPRRHAQLRREHWRTELALVGWEDELPAVPRFPMRGRIAVWTARRFNDQAFFWRTVELLAERDVELWRVVPPRSWQESVSLLLAVDVPVAITQATRMTATEVRAARARWREFATGKVDRLLRHLGPVARRFVLDRLPRLVRGKLALSRLDNAFARSGEPVVLARRRDLGRYLDDDVSMLTRLVRWAHPRFDALRMIPQRGDHRWRKAQYHLTPRGRALLRRGLDSPEQAPPLILGGHEIYSPHTFVALPDGSVRRF